MDIEKTTAQIKDDIIRAEGLKCSSGLYRRQLNQVC